jgi:hypothetical protein
MKNRKKKSKQPDISPALMVPSAGELITTHSLGTMIHWHPESVRRACRQGRIEAVKLGRGWRLPPAATANILKNGIPTNSN